MTTKFSQFVDGSIGYNTDTLVGLRSGVNTRTTFTTGIKDGDGNLLVGWVSGGALAVNYPQLLSSLTGDAVTIRAQGADSDIQLDLVSVGGGNLRLVPGATGEVFVDATTSIKVAAGTTLQRPTGSSGAFRYNTTTDFLEFWDIGTGAWDSLVPGVIGVTSVTGTANQIDVAGTTTPVLSLSSTLVAPGTFRAGNILTTTNTITSTTGGIIFTPLAGEDLTMNFSSGGEFFLNGAMDLIHTATEADDHALEVDCDAAGFGDVKGIDLAYTSGAISAGLDEAAILVNIDESASTGGAIAALEVLTTAEGLAAIYGLETFVNVNPVLQSAGTFGDMDSALNKAVDVLAALISGGAGNISGFVADNDTMTFGDAAKFEEMEIILGTGASGAGIAPTYEYSTGVGTWATFSPIDGTNAFRNTGAIAWLVGDIPGWMVGTGAEFLIRITRTRNSLSTTPILDEVQIAATTEFMWDSSGDLTVNSVDIAASSAYQVAGTAILSDSAGTMTLSNIDLLDPTTALTMDIANYAADAGGDDTYAITLDPIPAAYYDGMAIKAKVATANTGPATMNVNSLGAIAITKLHDQALVTGDIEANQIIELVYNSTSPTFQLQSQTAATPGGGTVTSVATGTALQGGPITSSGTINLATQNALGGRLTLTTATPVTTADVTAATTIYFTPYKGQDADIYTGSAWARFQLTELSIAVPATTDTAYDLFLDYNSGTPALATEAWSSVTARNTALAYQDGVLVLSGTATKRYIGSFVTTGVSGETEDSAANRYIWNYYNRVDRPLYKAYADTSWTYTSTTVRQAAGSTTNQVELMIGVAEDTVKFRTGTSSVGEAGDGYIMGVGVNSTTTMEDTEVCVSYSNVATLSPTYVSFEKIIPIGYSYLASLESIVGTGTTTVYSSLGALKSHIIGSLKG